ncbi:tyrosine-type recombinase/integrase [Nonomuraea typhae]|uniref:tyrosine-type recombinase/integrase n=1 Tax=Nonomuraea typhae TaxID=2603600 RepID=UPI001CA49E44|nr:site-specific integrase [Nonomuraea typhae]
MHRLTHPVDAFLATIPNANTAKAYAIALRALAAELGSAVPLPVLEGDAGADRVAEWFAGRWCTAAAATFNARMNALDSACAWWRDQSWLADDPLRWPRRRARTLNRTRALDRGQVETLLTRQGLPLRERTLFRLLYESAARAEEVLALDVDELDLRNRRARLALSSADLDPGFGRARLSYRRAAVLFEAATADLPGGPYTLHQLRHGALMHAAEDRANTSTLLAYSGHTSVVSLARYTRLSPKALAR